jgi:hypothetical protein
MARLSRLRRTELVQKAEHAQTVVGDVKVKSFTARIPQVAQILQGREHNRGHARYQSHAVGGVRSRPERGETNPPMRVTPK